MKRLLIASAFVVAFAAPTFAQTAVVAPADEFYVVQDASTKKCTIVDKKPTTTTTTTIVSDGIYKTRTEAETGMKSIKVCTN